MKRIFATICPGRLHLNGNIKKSVHETDFCKGVQNSCTRRYTSSIDSDGNDRHVDSPDDVAVELPDYNTSTDIHLHKLSRPSAPPRPVDHSKRWRGLEGLKQRTQGSLIPQTLKEMDEDVEFKDTLERLKKEGQQKLTKEERQIRQRALDNLGVPPFLRFWKKQKEKHGIVDDVKTLHKSNIDTLQLNIGIYCNQACNHCHVESSPKRTEVMSREVAERCIQLLEGSPSVHTLDLTGGAPELCPEFRYLASSGRKLGRTVIDRCNLTSLLEPDQEDTAEFLAKNGIHIMASLPCYTAKNVNIQRGSGVFDKSIQALLMLNELGYGKPETGLNLDLVYNPLGAFLPPPQGPLEEKYKEELWDVFGITFNKLYTITNMPIKRFADFLYRRNEMKDYMGMLVRNYNLKTMDGLMCINTLSVDWRGNIFDCDLNQQLAIGSQNRNIKRKGVLNVFDIDSADDLEGNKIATDNHCYGCTAGMGSS